MAIGSNDRKKIPVFKNLNLTPLLDFVVATIPVLLLSVNFMEYVILDTSLPVYSDDPTAESSVDKDKQPKLGLSIAITEEGFVIAGQGGILNADGKGTLIKKLTNGSYDYLDLSSKLLDIKNKYPDEWSVIIIPEATTRFEDIIATMDASRERLANTEKGRNTRRVMFPNVVLGGGVL